jgi:membrane-anchored protein YejM (alkaline phosphatase superfamily)
MELCFAKLYPEKQKHYQFELYNSDDFQSAKRINSFLNKIEFSNLSNVFLGK